MEHASSLWSWLYQQKIKGRGPFIFGVREYLGSIQAEQQCCVCSQVPGSSELVPARDQPGGLHLLRTRRGGTQAVVVIWKAQAWGLTTSKELLVGEQLSLLLWQHLGWGVNRAAADDRASRGTRVDFGSPREVVRPLGLLSPLKSLQVIAGRGRAI